MAAQFARQPFFIEKAPFWSSFPVSPSGEAPTWSAKMLQFSEDVDCLVVDTFPSGIGHEITEEMISQFERSLAARYLREEMYPNLRLLFVVLPSMDSLPKSL